MGKIEECMKNFQCCSLEHERILPRLLPLPPYHQLLEITETFIFRRWFVLFDISHTHTRRIDADLFAIWHLLYFSNNEFCLQLPPLRFTPGQSIHPNISPVMKYNLWAVAPRLPAPFSRREETEKLVCRIPGIIISYWQSWWPSSCPLSLADGKNLFGAKRFII